MLYMIKLAGANLPSACINPSGSGLQANYTLPENGLQLILVDANAQNLCNMTFGHHINQTNGLVQSSSLFQNFPSRLHQIDCRSKLSEAYGVGLQALQDGVQICIDDLELLPSYVNFSGAAGSYLHGCSY